MREIEWVDECQNTLANQHKFLTIGGENKDLMLQQNAGDQFEGIFNPKNIKEIQQWIVKDW